MESSHLHSYVRKAATTRLYFTTGQINRKLSVGTSLFHLFRYPPPFSIPLRRERACVLLYTGGKKGEVQFRFQSVSRTQRETAAAAMTKRGGGGLQSRSLPFPHNSLLAREPLPYATIAIPNQGKEGGGMPIRNSSSTCRPNTSAISIPTAYGRDSVIEKKRKSSPEVSLRGGNRKGGRGVINMKRKLSELLPLAPPTRRGQFLSSSREEERLTFASGAQKAIIGVQREEELQSRFNEGA